MAKAFIPQTEAEGLLTQAIAEFYDDPFGFIMFIFPWGEEGTALEDHSGPDEWQRLQMLRVSEILHNDPSANIREAIASGHGIGKSAETAWLMIWAMSTRPHLKGVITANTGNQLHTKTWAELAVWHKRALNKHWFEWTATKFAHIEHPETWFMAATPNNENNSEAFAGLHGQHSLIIYDEASAIPDIIWEVSEGAMTDPRAMWFVFGNPTKNTGKFRQCFNDESRWTHNNIDSRTCKMTNKKEIAMQLAEYGDDSDFARIRVKGEFPRTGSQQFMSSEVVDYAMRAEALLGSYFHMPIVMAVDVARFGGDKSVIVLRQGLKILDMIKYRELSTMELAARAIELIRKWQPVAIFVDSVGVGGGVCDRLTQLGHFVIEVNPGVKAYDEDRYKNKRIEMWDRMRQWLNRGADIPNDLDLRNALTGIEFDFDDKDKMFLERKKDMKSRGLDSPDEGDALAYSFAEDVCDTLMKGSFEPSNVDGGEGAYW